MMKHMLQHAALATYGLLVRTGVMKLPWTQRAFLTTYAAYKSWIEAGPVDALEQFVGLGSVVIDVGANIGYFTLKFADWVGAEGRVIAIEPDRENFRMLADKVAKSGLSEWVQLELAAVSAEAGTVRLQRNELHPGDHRIATGTDGIEIPALTIDGIAAALPRRPVSLIKIDVQGAEMLVLAGARRTLAEQRPALFVEVDDRCLRHFGSSAAELIADVEAQGYQSYRLSKHGSRKVSREQLLQELQGGAYIDVLFLPAPDHGLAKEIA